MCGELRLCGLYLCACALPICAFLLPLRPLTASVPKRQFEERTQRHLCTRRNQRLKYCLAYVLPSLLLSLFSNRYGAMIIVTGFVGKQLVWYVAQSNIKEIHEKQHKEGKTPL